MSSTQVRSHRLSQVAIFGFFSACIVAYHIFAFIGHYGFDDMEYAHLAFDLLHGKADFANHFTYRITVVGFTAIFYGLFGVSDFASALPPILATLAILFLVARTLRHYGLTALSIGLALTCFSPWFIFYSDKLMPDMYVALGVLAAMITMHRYRYIALGRKPFAHALLCAAALFFAFLSKASIVLLIPWVLFIFASDIFQKKHTRFWIFFVLSGLSMLVFYGVLSGWLSGNVLARLDAIMINGYLNACSYDQQSIAVLLHRLAPGFFQLLLTSGIALPLVFLFPAFAKNRRATLRMGNGADFWAASAIVLFLSCNFMTISPLGYIPMCLDARHYLFFIPPLAIAVAPSVQAVFLEKKGAWFVICILAILSFAAWWVDSDLFTLLYAPLLALLLLVRLIKIGGYLKLVVLVVFILILALKPSSMVSYSQKIDYEGQMRFVDEQVLALGNEAQIYTDPVMARIAAYRAGFDTAETPRFFRFDEVVSDSSSEVQVFVLLNGYTMLLSGLTEGDLPFYAQPSARKADLLASDSLLQVSLLRLQSSGAGSFSRKRLLSTMLDFDEPRPNWDYDPESLVADSHAQGFSASVGMYSATFSILVDSLHFDSEAQLFIDVQLQVFSDGLPSSVLVVSCEKEGNTEFYASHGLAKYQKAQSNWFSAHFLQPIPIAEMNAGAILKVYVYNPQKEDLLIDDFHLSVFQ